MRHTFTHFHLELTVARATATTGGLAKLAPGTSWCTVDRMTERALPTVMRQGDRARGEELIPIVRRCASASITYVI